MPSIVAKNLLSTLDSAMLVYIVYMNNFLRQFGSFKKNKNGLNEYVDYLGARYTQDPNTGMWKSNGRSLNEQMLFEEALKSQGGYGGEEGSGGRSQASRAPVYTLGFAASASQSTGLADPFPDKLSILDGTQTDWNGRYVTNVHTTEVPVKLKLTAKNLQYTPTAVTLVFRTIPDGTTRLSLNLLTANVNDETSTYNIVYPAPTNVTYSFRYSVSRGVAFYNPGDKLEFTIELINAQLGTVIDTFAITDTQS